MPLPVVLSPAGRVAVVTPAGELDVANAGVLRAALREAVATPASHVVVDLRGVSFVDSSVLGVLVEVHRALPAQRTLLVANAHGLPLRALQVTGLDGVLDVRALDDPLDERLALASG